MKVPVKNQHTRGVPRPKRAVAAALGLAFVVAVLAGTFAVAWFDGRLAQEITDLGGTAGGGIVDNLTKIYKQAWPRQRAADAAGPEIPVLRFDVKFKHIRKLAKKREQALQRKYLLQEEDDYVPATIHLTDGAARRTVRAKIRLKGDFTDHLLGEKWSFRVKVKGNGHLLGMRVFSVQHPRVRGYAHEALFLEHMRREGVLAPRYRFVRTVVNGRDKGIMALEEHYSKELLESQRRRESVIVRFDESLKWRTLYLMGQEVNFAAPYPLVKPFQRPKVAASPILRRDLAVAVGLLRGFITKELRPSQVFDPHVTARFLAVAEIWGAEHALVWNNLRFYYNPLTGLLEPVAFDANLQDYAFRFIRTALVSVYRLSDHVSANWLEDEAIRRPFLAALARMSEQFPEQAKGEWFDQEQAMNEILHQEFPLIAAIPFDFYTLRSARLRAIDADNFRILPLMPPNYPVLLHAFVHASPNGHCLELYNLVPYPLEVTSLTCTPASVALSHTLPIKLPPTRDLAPPTPVRIDLTSPEDIGDVKVRVGAWIPGYPDTKSTLEALPYTKTNDRPVLPQATWEIVQRDHDYVVRDGDHASLGPGDFTIRRPLILPRGVMLTIAAGTTLRFSPDALLVVRGSLQMKGTTDAPIQLLPSRRDWRGVAVMGAATESTWTHVHVSHTSGLQLGDWQPTGSVMFYESEVSMRDCRFTDNRAEDAINLVRSGFALERVTIERTFSDAIDVDFGRGSIVGGHLVSIGGDAIDVSGTNIDVSGTRFGTIHDKALSVGEGSELLARHVQINGAGTGLATKDGSVARIEHSVLENIKHVAIMAFTKKPEFGPGVVRVTDVRIDGATHDHLAQIGSTIEVDGKPIKPIKLDVDELYATGHMKKQ